MPNNTSELAVFEFQGARLGSLKREDEPWFVAADVAKILGYRDASNMVRRLDGEDICYSLSEYQGQRRRILLISEPGIYMAVFGSQSPQAVAFKRWLAGDVIPSIRKTGKYVAPDHIRQILGLELERVELEGEADQERWRAEELQQQLDNVLADRDRWRREAYARRCDHPKNESDGSCIHGRACSFVG